MKNLSAAILIFVIVCLSLAVGSNQNLIPPAQQKNIEKEILKIHEDMKKAAENFNTDALFQHVLDSNDVIIENGVIRQTRKDAYEITKQNLEGIKKLTYSYNHKNIAIISSTTAIWTGQGTIKVKLDDGREITRDFAETIVFDLQDGQWKVLHAHRSSPN